MFRKICTRVRIFGKVIHAIPYVVRDKKVVNHSNTQLPYAFDTIQLRTPYDLNKYRWWT